MKVRIKYKYYKTLYKYLENYIYKDYRVILELYIIGSILKLY